MQGKDTPISALKSLLQDELNQLNTMILSSVSSSVPLVSEVVNHVISAGGKRLRPLLTLAFARLFHPVGDIKPAIAIAAAVELIHTATLIHDDVIDESPKRRGVSTANDIWDNKTAVLVGDFLFSKAFHMMVQSGSLALMDLLAMTSTRICEGEVKQLTVEGDINASLDDYLDIIELKTASLFEAACLSGALLYTKDHVYLEHISRYGHHLGMIFQLIDDILDYDVDNCRMGKKLGNDFKEGKVTLPVLLALTKKEDVPMLKTWFDNPTDDNFVSITNYMKQHHILTRARHEAEKDCLYAKESLFYLPDSAFKDLLIQLVDEVLGRDK
jgi:octaprenyl-diphosphate synthase